MKTIFLLIAYLTPFSFFAQQGGVSPLEAAETSKSGQTYAVVVGISDYQDEDIPDLRFADM